MTTVLLVWEEIPEDTEFYKLEGEAAELAIAAHGCIINRVDGDPNGAADRLSGLLENLEPVDRSNPIDASGIDRIVLSGFMM